LDGRPGSLKPNPEVADFLNALVDPRRQLMLPVLHLLPTMAPQTECQFPLLDAKADIPGFARQGHHNGLVVEGRQTSQANGVNLTIE
jgi:hypothetical protein